MSSKDLLEQYDVEWMPVKYHMAYRASVAIAIGYVGGKEPEVYLVYPVGNCQFE